MAATGKPFRCHRGVGETFWKGSPVAAVEGDALSGRAAPHGLDVETFPVGWGMGHLTSGRAAHETVPLFKELSLRQDSAKRFPCRCDGLHT